MDRAVLAWDRAEGAALVLVPDGVAPAWAAGQERSARKPPAGVPVPDAARALVPDPGGVMAPGVVAVQDRAPDGAPAWVPEWDVAWAWVAEWDPVSSMKTKTASATTFSAPRERSRL